jgi:hypothetical protein
VTWDDYLSVGSGRPPLIGRHRFVRHVQQTPVGNLPLGVAEPFVIPHHMRDEFLAAKVRYVADGGWDRGHEAALARKSKETQRRIAALQRELDREAEAAERSRQERINQALMMFRMDIEKRRAEDLRIQLAATVRRQPPPQTAMQRRRTRVRNRLDVLYESLAAPEW